MPSARVTVTLPEEVVRDVDRVAKNRSRFILEAVRLEIRRRRRGELKRSLQAPHPESEELSALGMDEWHRGLPDEDAASLIDPTAGTAVRWTPGVGWREVGE